MIKIFDSVINWIIDLDPIPESSLYIALSTLRECKPNDGSEKDRRYAITITMLEQAYAYFVQYVIRGESEEE